MSLSRQVGRGALLQIGARLFSAAVNFVVVAAVLARVLPPEAYGRFQFHWTMYLLAMSLVDFGANRAAIRLISAGEAEEGRAVRAAVVFKAAVGLVLFLAMAGVSLAIEQDRATAWACAFAAAHALSHAWGGASVGFEAELDFRVPSLAVVVGYGFFLLSGLLLAGVGVAEAPPYLLAWGAGVVVQNLVLRVAAARRHPLRGLDPEVLRKVAREAVPLGLSAVAVAVYYHSDTLMLRPLRGEADVARYAVAYRLMSFGLLVPVLFSRPLFPALARLAGRSRAALGHAVAQATFQMAWIGASAAAGLVALAPDLLGVVFGERYRSSAPLLRVLALALFCVHLTYPHTTALIAAGFGGAFTRLTLAAAALNVAANLYAIPRFGPMGAALTTLATEAFVLLGGVGALVRRVGVHGVTARLFGPAVLGVAVWAALAGPLASAPLALRLAVGAALAVTGAWALGAFPLRLEPEGDTPASRG